MDGEDTHVDAELFVLDDDPAILRMLESALARLGRVHASMLWSDVSRGIIMSSRSAAPTVLVCDLKMPGISGAEFCRIVHHHAPSVIIVIFSGSPGEAPSFVHAVVGKKQGVPALVQQLRSLLTVRRVHTPPGGVWTPASGALGDATGVAG